MEPVVIDKPYTSGAYFSTPSRHAEDAEFKASNFLALFLAVARAYELEIASYADVGCGSGATSQLVAAGLQQAGMRLVSAQAYDVSPHVAQLRSERVQFIHGDFRRSNDRPDLVTLFDVFEHVVAPLEFLRDVSAKCNLIGLHIPLDDSLNNELRDKFHSLLKNPGHLVYLNVVSALNLLTMAGLRVLDYRYAFGYRAPSGRRTFKARALYPVRWLLGAISPWLLSRVLGGASLVVVAATPRMLSEGGGRRPATSGVTGDGGWVVANGHGKQPWNSFYST